MATRGTISKINDDGRIRSIYCHWDSYPEHVGKLLNEVYNTPEKVDALLDLGDVSALYESIERPDGHSFEAPVDGHSIFYGRDRGESGTEARSFISYSEYLLSGQPQEYNYLFKDGKWYCQRYKMPLLFDDIA